MKTAIFFLVYLCFFIAQNVSAQVRTINNHLNIKYTCFGKSPSDANVCSSKGTCNATDTCYCGGGYDGVQCETNIGNEFNIVYTFGKNTVKI